MSMPNRAVRAFLFRLVSALCRVRIGIAIEAPDTSASSTTRGG